MSYYPPPTKEQIEYIQNTVEFGIQEDGSIFIEAIDDNVGIVMGNVDTVLRDVGMVCGKVRQIGDVRDE